MATNQYEQKPAAAQPGQAPPQNDEVQAWVTLLNDSLKDSSRITNPQGTSEWSSSFFECFFPIDTCVITYFCPCVTFGKTNHRLRHGGDISTWSPVNASCLIWLGAACVGFHCVPTLMQKSVIRHKATPPRNGDFVTDFLKAWCCHCCELVHQDKEADHLLANEGLVMQEPPKAQGMNYPA